MVRLEREDEARAHGYLPGFNPTMVRLERNREGLQCQRCRSFNPTMVRLEQMEGNGSLT